jgi:muconolactone delta-isomerase
MPARLKIEILTYSPTILLQCRHCELALREAGVRQRVRQDQLTSGLPPEFAAENSRLSAWVHEQIARHGTHISVEIVDVASVKGFWRSLWRRVGRYPAIIIGRESFAAADLDAAEARLASLLSPPVP